MTDKGEFLGSYKKERFNHGDDYILLSIDAYMKWDKIYYSHDGVDMDMDRKMRGFGDKNNVLSLDVLRIYPDIKKEVTDWVQHMEYQVKRNYKLEILLSHE